MTHCFHLLGSTYIFWWNEHTRWYISVTLQSTSTAPFSVSPGPNWPASTAIDGAWRALSTRGDRQWALHSGDVFHWRWVPRVEKCSQLVTFFHFDSTVAGKTWDDPKCIHKHNKGGLTGFTSCIFWYWSPFISNKTKIHCFRSLFRDPLLSLIGIDL